MQDYKELTLEELYEIGYETGERILDANASELPVIGTPGTHAEDAEDWRDEVKNMAHDAEENMRCFSPFEFFAKDLNDRDDPDEAWDSYDEGVAEGISHAVDELRPRVSESYAIERTREMLDEVHEPVKIGDLEYDAGYVLQEVDPVAFWQEVLAWADSEGLDID